MFIAINFTETGDENQIAHLISVYSLGCEILLYRRASGTDC